MNPPKSIISLPVVRLSEGLDLWKNQNMVGSISFYIVLLYFTSNKTTLPDQVDQQYFFSTFRLILGNDHFKESPDEHDSLQGKKGLNRIALLQAMLYSACFFFLIFLASTLDLNEIKAKYVNTGPLLFWKTQVVKMVRARIFEKKQVLKCLSFWVLCLEK